MTGSRTRRRGNVAMTAALMVLPLALLAALGIDFGRVKLAQSQLAQAVDAGALAGARVLGARDPAADARMYFDANLQARAVELTRFAVIPSRDGNLVVVEATGRVATTFMRLAGPRWATLPIGARATARRTTLGMELALVLDTTGSMAGSAITELRRAALDLVGILYGTASTLDTLYISVVPYTNNVNFGPDRLNWLQPGSIDIDPVTGRQRRVFSPTDRVPYEQFSWRGCVEARGGGEDTTDAPPAVRPFVPFFYRSTRSQTAAAAWGYRTGTEPRLGDNDWGSAPAIASTETPDRDDADHGLDPATSYTNANERKGPNVGCGHPIAGLTSERAGVERIIRALQPVNRGGTMANVGLQAGWMTLSPRWRGLWGASRWGTATPAGLPLDYPGPTSFMSKVIVLMTDGNNEWYDYPRPPGPDYTAYGRLTEGRLGTTSAGQANRAINDRMATMCGRIKAQGIRIYAITLGSLTTATRTLYENCSSGPGYYFNSPRPADLRNAFREIGSQLANLRLER